MDDARSRIADVLRGRVLRGIHAGALQPGDRLQTSRELAGEFDVDYRVVIDAYKELQGEGLVELRPRGGVYIAQRQQGRIGIPALPETWIVQVFVDALAREIPIPELAGWLERSIDTLKLRAGVVAETDEQLQALCRELEDDFGLEAIGIAIAEVARAATPMKVDLIVTTDAHAEWAKRIAADGTKVIALSVEPELFGHEWALLLRRPLYAVVESAALVDTLRAFYADLPGIENLHILVLGRDALARIPEGAPTYLTRGVRTRLGQTRMPGRILPAGRMIASGSAREILEFVVRANIDAMLRIGR